MSYPNTDSAMNTYHMKSCGRNITEDDENFYEVCPPIAVQPNTCNAVMDQGHYQRPSASTLKPPASSQQQPAATATTTSTRRKPLSNKFGWKAIAFISLLIAIAAMALSLQIYFSKKSDRDAKIEIINKISDSLIFPQGQSCQMLRKQGYFPSGFYSIFLGTKRKQVTIYCDMESDGGGWTLVASINDKSFHDQCPNNRSWIDGRTWLNNLTFGRIEDIPAKEYKNAAFYNLEATDVMIWHIPNQADIFRISEQALLKYHTDDHFLRKYQSNLRSIFLESLKLTLAHKFINKISDAAIQITSAVQDWNNYNYDGTITGFSISDGGNDMYDTGNKISIRADNDSFRNVRYGSNYNRSDLGYSVTSLAIHPFTMLVSIENSTAAMSSFTIQVSSNLGADGRGKYISNTGLYTHGGTSIKYKYFQVYNASDPSVCEVYFAISNSKWESSTDVTLREKWSNNTDKTENTITFANMRNVVIGYILLSRTKGKEVTPQQVRGVMTRVANIAGSVQLRGGIEVKVTFVKGSAAEISSSLSGKQTRNVQPGYIEFKAMDRTGDRYALCPGVRFINHDDKDGLSNFCLGKILSTASETSCPVETNRKTRNSSSSRETKWFNNQTSILIFTRNSTLPDES